MMPSGFIALLSGWFVTEIGRQPLGGVWRAAHETYGDNRRMVTSPQVAWSLLSFVVIYTFVFGAGSYYILKLIGQAASPIKDDKDEGFYTASTEAAASEGARPRLTAQQQGKTTTMFDFFKCHARPYR